MSNYLAIATVTATLQKLLQAAVQADLDGARVTTLKPSSLGNGTPETGINLYLYQVTLNPAWRNSADVRGRNRKGDSAKRSRTALDLHYMLSFYGNEIELEPQRLLGSAVRILSDSPTLTSTLIQDTIRDSSFRYLSGANLMEQLEDITVSPMDLSLEDLSKAWSVFFQTPYILSLAYRATAVMIEGDDVAQKALLVRRAPIATVIPFASQPVVHQVTAQTGSFDPIQATSTLLIQGSRLQGQFTQVRIGGVEITPPSVTDTQISLPLSLLPLDVLKAGVQTLQVIHTHSDASTQPIRFPVATAVRPSVVESNLAAFVICPTIQSIQIEDLRGQDEESRSATLIIQTDLPIDPDQAVVLMLNEFSVTHPAAYLFEASPRPTSTRSIRISVYNVQPADYLVRLRVAGAESLLQVDQDSSSATFQWYIAPRVLVV